jgi:hypothetical protein
MNAIGSGFSVTARLGSNGSEVWTDLHVHA